MIEGGGGNELGGGDGPLIVDCVLGSRLLDSRLKMSGMTEGSDLAIYRWGNSTG